MRDESSRVETCGFDYGFPEPQSQQQAGGSTQEVQSVDVIQRPYQGTQGLHSNNQLILGGITVGLNDSIM